MKISKREALEVLERSAGSDNWISKEYFEAIRDDRLAEHFYQRFFRRRWEYRDELPADDVRELIVEAAPNEPFCQYKCQVTYVFGLCLDLRNFVEYFPDAELGDKIAGFLQSNLGFKIGDPINLERIERINGILDEVLAYLGGRISV